MDLPSAAQTLFDERTKLAFQSAADLAKQLITLGTGTLALSVTFTKDVLRRDMADMRYLKSAWVCLTASIIAGVWSMAALTGTLVPIRNPTPEEVAIASNARVPAGLQELLYLVGLLLLVMHVWRGLGKPQPNDG